MRCKAFFPLWVFLLLFSELVGGCSRQQSPINAANAFFVSVSRGDFQQAYDSTAFAFQAGQSLQSFQATVQDVGFVGGAAATHWTQTQVTGDEAKLGGTVKGVDASIAVQITLIRERGQWRLFALHIPTTGKPGDAPLAQNRFTLVGKGASFSNAVNRPPPSDEVSRQLVEDTLVMFNDAVQRRSFVEFYSGVSYSWQRQLTLHQLQTAFQPFIDAEANLGPLRSLTAVFDEAPHINSDGVLVLNGHYPPHPYTVYFALRYIYELPHWKLFGIDVRLGK